MRLSLRYVIIIGALAGLAAYWTPELYHDWKFLHAARVQNDILSALPHQAPPAK